MARRRTKSMNDIDAQYRRIKRLRQETGSNVGRSNEFNIAARYIVNIANKIGKPLMGMTSDDLNRQFSRRTYMGLSNG